MRTYTPSQKRPKRIYLDYASTTPVDPKVWKAMAPFWSHDFGNPSAIYQSGLKASQALNSARQTIASILNCRSNDIIFTAGGTESNNLAILGIAKQYTKTHGGKTGHIISSATEHHSVLETLEALKEDGWKISFAPIDTTGMIDLEALKQLVQKNTALVTIMYANNEIGTIQPIQKIGEWLNGLNKIRTKKSEYDRIYFHSDACQGAGYLELDVTKLKVDLLTLNGSKIYGPKQTGLLFVKNGVEIQPVIFGGGQEHNLRSGTENVPGVVGLAKALELVQSSRTKEIKRLHTLQVYLHERLLKKVNEVRLNGPDILRYYNSKNSNIVKIKSKSRTNTLVTMNRLPNNLNLSFKGVSGESLMLYLDSKGIEVSTGSACATASLDPSHVILALGESRMRAYEAIRITLGRGTTKLDLDKVIKETVKIIEMLRKTHDSTLK